MGCALSASRPFQEVSIDSGEVQEAEGVRNTGPTTASPDMPIGGAVWVFLLPLGPPRGRQSRLQAAARYRNMPVSTKTQEILDLAAEKAKSLCWSGVCGQNASLGSKRTAERGQWQSASRSGLEKQWARRPPLALNRSIKVDPRLRRSSRQQDLAYSRTRGMLERGQAVGQRVLAVDLRSHNSGTCSASYASTSTPRSSINEASGCLSSSPTSSTS